jgi:hypothetical protein
VLLLRDGDGRLEAFGAGRVGPAAGWLVDSGHRFVLHAPPAWQDAFRGRLDQRGVEYRVARVETWAGPGTSPVGRAAGGRVGNMAMVRRLATGDAAGFGQAAPPWALWGWRSFDELLGHGAAFGVPLSHGFAALAWVFDSAGRFDALGVATAPRFRRLGLGLAAAAALVDHVVGERGRVPLWSVRPENLPSRALARALGFALAAEETLLCWPVETGATESRSSEVE